MRRLILLLVLLIASCVDATKQQAQADYLNNQERSAVKHIVTRMGTLPYGYPIYRIRDDSLHVTCWTVHEGISCLRDSEKQ